MSNFDLLALTRLFELGLHVYPRLQQRPAACIKATGRCQASLSVSRDAGTGSCLSSRTGRRLDAVSLRVGILVEEPPWQLWDCVCRGGCKKQAVSSTQEGRLPCEFY
jgi:hypothetical protein